MPGESHSVALARAWPVEPSTVLFAGSLFCAVAVPCIFLLSSNDVFELTKQVEIIKKRLAKLEAKDESALL